MLILPLVLPDISLTIILNAVFSNLCPKPQFQRKKGSVENDATELDDNQIAELGFFF